MITHDSIALASKVFEATLDAFNNDDSLTKVIDRVLSMDDPDEFDLGPELRERSIAARAIGRATVVCAVAAVDVVLNHKPPDRASPRSR